MSANLLPCPFCAGGARETVESDFDYPIKQFMHIQCARCGARTASIYGSGDPSEWADARHNWNQRTTPALPASQGIDLATIETPESESISFSELQARGWFQDMGQAPSPAAAVGSAA